MNMKLLQFVGKFICIDSFHCKFIINMLSPQVFKFCCKLRCHSKATREQLGEENQPFSQTSGLGNTFNVGGSAHTIQCVTDRRSTTSVVVTCSMW